MAIVFFIALAIAEIVRFFKNDEDFDGVMLFARPLGVLVGILLLGESFWTALIGAVVWGVLGFGLAALLSEYFGDDSDDTPKTTFSPPTPAPQPAPRRENTAPKQETTKPKEIAATFTFADGILPDQDARYCKAKASDGVIYYRFSFGERSIGSYELNKDGDCVTIYEEAHRAKIGYVMGDEIFLTREGLYQRECEYAKQYGYSVKYPSPMTLNLAELRNGYIKDNTTYEYLGEFTGDRYAAAAAFVCLIYECHSDFIYHYFYQNWDKE